MLPADLHSLLEKKTMTLCLLIASEVNFL